MKTAVSIEKTLSEDQLTFLKDWLKEHKNEHIIEGITLYKLSIGDMIEFLGHYNVNMEIYISSDQAEYNIDVNTSRFDISAEKVEIADILFQSVISTINHILETQK